MRGFSLEFTFCKTEIKFLKIHAITLSTKTGPECLPWAWLSLRSLARLPAEDPVLSTNCGTLSQPARSLSPYPTFVIADLLHSITNSARGWDHVVSFITDFPVGFQLGDGTE